MCEETEKLAWLAGFFDGEGWIGIEKGYARSKWTNKKYQRPRYRIAVAITQANREILDYILINFGGRIVNVKRIKFQHKKQWQWKANDFQAEKIIKQIYPYLKLKKLQADIVLDFLKTKPKIGVNFGDNILDLRTKLYSKMKEINSGRQECIFAQSKMLF